MGVNYANITVKERFLSALHLPLTDTMSPALQCMSYLSEEFEIKYVLNHISIIYSCAAPLT